MKKEKINNLNLQRLIALKCNKLDFKDVTDEDLEKIQEITLHGKLINGKMSGIDLESIQLFPNLITLGISDFTLTQGFIRYISELSKLKSIEIISCFFEEIDFSTVEENLSDIRFIGCRNLPFKYPKQKSIIITGSEIDFNNIDFSGAENVEIIESNIKNAYDLIDFTNLVSINLDGSKLFDKHGEILEDIKVPKGAQYSHALEIKAVDPR